MKKLFSLFVPLMALLLTLAPMTAKAQYTGNDGNGHNWVILWEGGPRWATVNIGASSETEAGNYYMWGGTTANATTTWAYVPYKGSNQNTAPYNKYGYANDGKLELEAGDDAATQAWGVGWRTPTKVEMDDLKVYCNITYDGTNKGIRYTSKTTGQSIFLRSAGYKGNGSNNGTDIFNADKYGKYMTATSTTSPGSNKYQDCYYLLWYTNSYKTALDRQPSTTNGDRYTGISVRAIYVPSAKYDVTVQADNTGYGSVGGTTSMKDVVEGSAITINGNTLTLDGKTATATPIAADANYIYYFTGWTSGGSSVENGDALSDDMTITANFDRKSSNCTVTIATPAGYGNISVSDGTNSYTVGQNHTFNRYTDSGKVLTVTATPASGCVFVSWLGDLTQTGTNPYTATYTISTTTPDNITIGATFAPTYTVTFKDYDGTDLVAPFALKEGLVPTYSGSTPTKAGYVFTGWTDGNSLFTSKNDALPALTSDVVYTATYVIEPDYFTITNTNAAAKTITIKKGSGTTTKPTFQYRLLNASGVVTTNWTTLSITSTTGTNISIPANGKIQLYGTNPKLGSGTSDYTKFSLPSSSTIKISGNILSLVACSSDGTTIDNNFSMPNYCFYGLFYYHTTTTIDAEDLELPSTTVSSYGYSNMFYECQALTKAPKELPATTLGTYCYYRMFYNCSTMVSAPERLPALALPEQCYYEMFYKNKALTTAPEIDATSVTGTQACTNMFYGCSALTQAPSKLKIESLRNNTYYYMFYGCTNLEKSPDIYATTYANNGMYCMFQNCSKLKQIRIYFSGTLGAYSSQTQTWVASVRSTGDFYCPPEISRTNDSDYGTSKIPLSSSSKWTIFSYNLTFVPKDCSWSDATNANKQFTWKTDTSDVNSFLRAEAGAKFYTNEACTNEITISEIQALLPTQQELSAETTKYIYARKVSSYALSWDANGGELSGSYTAAGSVNAGATITAPTATRTGYTFTGWSPSFTGIMPSTNVTYIAQWTKATTLDLYDDRGAAYYNNIKALNGQTYDVTYHRSVAYTSDNGNARWYTLCLPFDVDQSQLDLNGLTGKVYEYRYAEGSADENDHVTFHFRAVKSPGYMHAGQGYLVKATGDMGPDFTFTDVTLNTSADVEDGIVDNLKNSNAYKESGDIAIVGVLRNGTLSAAGKQVMGLANNKIWYPHSSGNPMPAYRAYFYNPSASASVMPRVRIVVEGEGETELEVVDGELYDAGGDVRAPSGAARKYIRNGVLIIERNGERYNAQGARM